GRSETPDLFRGIWVGGFRLLHFPPPEIRSANCRPPHEGEAIGSNASDLVPAEIAASASAAAFRAAAPGGRKGLGLSAVHRACGDDVQRVLRRSHQNSDLIFAAKSVFSHEKPPSLSGSRPK